jgi:hypothetical protein
MEYLTSTKLNILNRGHKTTFVVSNRQEVIDLIAGTVKTGDAVSNWRVSDQISFLDHNMYHFKWVTWKLPGSHIMTPKRTNWVFSHGNLKASLGVVPKAIHLVQQVELAVETLQKAILSSYHQNCPARVALLPNMVPWWNKQLRCLKPSIRWLFNQAKKEQVTRDHIR